MRILKNQEDVAFLPAAITPMPDSTSYLNKCQVDTPHSVIKHVWSMLKALGKQFDRVVDFGAGDGRFSSGGDYKSYVGYEIDASRLPIGNLPNNAIIKQECALSSVETGFDLCIGNPPFVRHHDIDKCWYEHVCRLLDSELGFRLDRRSNAFLLFLAKAIISTKADGMVALVIPFEWVSRPAARDLREYIKKNNWEVSAYRFTEEIFQNVMTTASLTIIDKSKRNSKWSYYSIDSNFKINEKKFASGDFELFAYSPRTEENFAQRGLSPGGQHIFCLTEGERIHHRLLKGIDVVPCITTMRHWKDDITSLTDHQFDRLYVNKGMRCWLLKTWEPPSPQLMAYLDSIPKEKRDNYTCNQRDTWWKARPHQPADIIYSSAFVGPAPKFLMNTVKAIAVGSIQGIHKVKPKNRSVLRKKLIAIDYGARVVAHSGRLRKIEVGQMNKIVADIINEISSEK
ncbi:Eco57I restriction-modification methylase domain-containing protein [Delftia deserti]|uniref:site-specific DNA-methyltransferase (adenine-specific) n=1 Tax=Delftia deserti TaxID=1651218 RepID=A0ABW5EQU3_9BURK